MLRSHLLKSNTFSPNCYFRLQKAQASQSREDVSFPAASRGTLAHTSSPSPMESPWMNELPPSPQLLHSLKGGNYFSCKHMQ